MSDATPKAEGGLLGWVDARFPLTQMWNEHNAEYYAPKNFNFCTSSGPWHYWCW